MTFSWENNQYIQKNESLGLDVSISEKVLGYSLPNLSQVVNDLVTEYKRGEFGHEL